MTDNITNIIEFPIFKSMSGNPEEILEAAKGWGFEQVIVIGFEKTSQTIIYSGEGDKRTWLEISELLRVMYLKVKGWL